MPAYTRPFDVLPDEDTISATVKAPGTHRRVREHSPTFEDVRAQTGYGVHSYIGRILEIQQETSGRIRLVLVRQVLGY